MFTKKYFAVPTDQAQPTRSQSPVTFTAADGSIRQEKPSMPHVDFHARLVGYNQSSARDSLYAYVVFLDSKIWRAHRRNMNEMQMDYDENYVERMGDVDTFPAGVSAVVWSLTGGKPLFVRVTVIKMQMQMDMPHFVCNGWDDCEEYVVSINEIFEMTPKTAEYPCMAVPLSLEGLHGFYDSSDMLNAFRRAWAECGAVYAGRCVRLKPIPEFPVRRDPARLRTYELRSFCNQMLNEKIAHEFVSLMDIYNYKSKDLHAVVTYIDHYSNIWFQIEADGYLERINLICDKTADTKKPLSGRPDGSNRVFAALGIDRKYHRAKFTQENGPDGAFVEFIDYGITDTCKYSNMYDLTQFDSLTACLGPRCMKVFLHNALQNLRLSDDERNEMLKRVKSFAPNTTVAYCTGRIVDSVSKKPMDVYEIIGGIGWRGRDKVNIHGTPQGDPNDPNARDKIHGIPDDYEPEELPPRRYKPIKHPNPLNL